MSGFNYSKWDKIELSDDEEVHPNIDKDSWVRMRHNDRVVKEEDDNKKQIVLHAKLKKAQDELEKFGEAGKEHAKAKKLQKEIFDIEEKLEKMEKEKKWNADNMCKTADNMVAVTQFTGPEVKPEPRLKGEAIAIGYCEFVEEHEDLLEQYIALGANELEEVRTFLQEHGGTLLQGEHAESYLLLDCLEKEMNGLHEEMVKSARQSQLLVQLREFSRASGRPARDGVMMVFQRIIEHEGMTEAFHEEVKRYIERLEKRAVEKKKEMDAEREEEEGEQEVGPGGLNPLEVLKSLPAIVREAFEAQDMARLNVAIESLPPDEAKYHMRRCEDSGLWCPSGGAPPPYRQDED